MKELRDLIDEGAPMIYAGNWKAEHEKGWRWALDLDTDADEAKRTILDFQHRYGVTNVAIGHSFADDSPKPKAGGNRFGLYVRDVDELIKEMQKNLDDPVAIGRWMNGEK